MPKLRKQRRKQKFRFDRNRKRVQKSQQSHSKKNIKVDCEVMKKNWDRSQPVKTNLTNMGLAYDPNKILKAKSVKTTMIEKINQTDTGGNIPKDRKNQISKVVKSLQEESESTKPQQTFRFTKEQTNWITYLLDKYGDDFQAMAKDRKNVWQETPKQIRQKVMKFVSIPEHFATYAKDRGLLELEMTNVE